MLNKVQIIGRLGRDPELKYTSGGMPTTISISLAVANAIPVLLTPAHIADSTSREAIFAIVMAQKLSAPRKRQPKTQKYLPAL